MRRDRIEHGLHASPQRVARTARQASKLLLDLAEDHLDRIEVRAVRWQEDKFGACTRNQLTRALSLVTRQVVHDDNVATAKLRHQYELNERLKDVGIHGPVYDRRTSHACKTKSGDQRGCLPVTVRHLRHQSCTPTRSASQPRHVGLAPRFVDEDQSARVELALVPLPHGTPFGDIRSILLCGMDCLFLKV